MLACLARLSICSLCLQTCCQTRSSTTMLAQYVSGPVSASACPRGIVMATRIAPSAMNTRSRVPARFQASVARRRLTRSAGFSVKASGSSLCPRISLTGKSDTITDCAACAGATEEDKMYMRRAIELAKTATGKTYPNPLVRAHVVRRRPETYSAKHPVLALTIA